MRRTKHDDNNCNNNKCEREAESWEVEGKGWGRVCGKDDNVDRVTMPGATEARGSEHNSENVNNYINNNNSSNRSETKMENGEGLQEGIYVYTQNTYIYIHKAINETEKMRKRIGLWGFWVFCHCSRQQERQK